MQLAVASVDLSIGVEVMEAQWSAGVPAEAVQAANMAIDLEADSNTCPACLSAIPGGSSRCPGCGLRVG